MKAYELLQQRELCKGCLAQDENGESMEEVQRRAVARYERLGLMLPINPASDVPTPEPTATQLMMDQERAVADYERRHARIARFGDMLLVNRRVAEADFRNAMMREEAIAHGWMRVIGTLVEHGPGGPISRCKPIIEFRDAFKSVANFHRTFYVDEQGKCRIRVNSKPGVSNRPLTGVHVGAAPVQ
jgi:hypothetical protein